MKELGKAEFTPGMEIDHNRAARTLIIKQTRYIDDVVKRFTKFQECRQSVCIRIKAVIIAVTYYGRWTFGRALEAIPFFDWMSSVHRDLHMPGRCLRGYTTVTFSGESRDATLERSNSRLLVKPVSSTEAVAWLWSMHTQMLIRGAIPMTDVQFQGLGDTR